MDLISLAYAKKLANLAEGPQGPPGEVTTQQLNTAIDNAVTPIENDVTQLKSDIAQFITDDVISHVDSDIQNGSYYISGGSEVAFNSNTSYYSVVSDLSNYGVGSEVIAKASLASGTGLIIYDANNHALNYVTETNAVEKGYEVSSTPVIVKLTIPQGAKYISASIRNTFYTNINDFKVTVRTNVVNDEISQIEKVLENEAVKKNLGKNKFDASTSVDGFIEAYNGSINPTVGTYKTTDFIDISTFEHSVCVSPRLRCALQYDQNKQYIRSTYISTAMSDAVISINEDAKYIRISYYANQENALQVEDNTSCTTYEQYSMYVEESVNCFNSKTRESVEDFIGSLDISAYNPLKDKKWVHCGDSFSAYTNANFDSGMFQGREKTFPRLIAERNGMNLLQQFMLSGRTLAYPADGTFTNSLTCPTNTGYYQNIPTDVDIVTIMLGINDCQHTGSGTTGDGEDATGVITLGTIDDATTATYYGAWNVVLGWLRENRPFAHVGIIVTNGTERQDYTEAQIAISQKWGYPLLNLNGDEHTSAMLRCYNPDISASLKAKLKEKQAVDYDGTITGSINLHPNYQTHEMESSFIEQWLKSL